MPLSPRWEVENLSPCPHGGPDYAELKKFGLAAEDVVDFSVSTNPFGPPPGVREALTSLPIALYPDSEATELRECLAQELSIAPENILAGSGSAELIRLVAQAYFGPQDVVLIVEPTFGEYEVACRVIGSGVLKQRLTAQEGFRLQVTETVDLIRRHCPKGVFLCNPNNPTGQYLAREEIEQILVACEDSLLILDEAYIAFVDNAWSSLDLIQRGNVLILRSLAKSHALAGLRLGYAMAQQQIIANLRKVCPPWNVNIVAQRAGILALADKEYMRKCKVGIQHLKDFLIKELTELGLQPLPSQANFFLVEVGDAKRFRRALLERGILVRDCTSFGLAEYIRIAPRPLPDCRKLITAIKEITPLGYEK